MSVDAMKFCYKLGPQFRKQFSGKGKNFRMIDLCIFEMLEKLLN